MATLGAFPSCSQKLKNWDSELNLVSLVDSMKYALTLENDYVGQNNISMRSRSIYCPPCWSSCMLNVHTDKALKLQLTDLQTFINWEIHKWSDIWNTTTVINAVWIRNQAQFITTQMQTHTSTVCSLKVKTRAKTVGTFVSTHKRVRTLTHSIIHLSVSV